jgi:hypothetical protein
MKAANPDPYPEDKSKRLAGLNDPAPTNPDSIDAARYRFLRMNWQAWTGHTWSGTEPEIADKLDQAIDSYMSATPTP